MPAGRGRGRRRRGRPRAGRRARPGRRSGRGSRRSAPPSGLRGTSRSSTSAPSRARVEAAPKANSSSGTGPRRASTGLLESAMTTKRSAAAATIFSRRWAPPPPLISQPSGVTSSVPSIAMSSRCSELELLDRDAQPARLLLGGDRGGDAADAAEAAARRSPAAGGRPSSRCRGRPSSRPRPAPPRPRPRPASPSSAHGGLYASPAGTSYGSIGTTYARAMDARIWLTGGGEEPRSVALERRADGGRRARRRPTSSSRTRRSPGTTWRSSAAARC